MKAINSTYAYSENIVATPFTCHKGEYTGENVNYLYCPYERLIYESEPITDEQGLILGRNYFVISDLVFNNTENPEMFEIIDYKFVNNICEKVI